MDVGAPLGEPTDGESFGFSFFSKHEMFVLMMNANINAERTLIPDFFMDKLSDFQRHFLTKRGGAE